jgi:hypothetical protein
MEHMVRTTGYEGGEPEEADLVRAGSSSGDIRNRRRLSREGRERGISRSTDNNQQ